MPVSIITLPSLHSDILDFPTRFVNQHLGMEFLDSNRLAPPLYRGFVISPFTKSNIEWSGHSEVQNLKDKFLIHLNMSHFEPDEITVKTVGNSVQIHAKHEKRSNEHCDVIAREFTRKFMLPEGAEPGTVVSSLSNGILTVEAPKKIVEEKPANEHIIPITIQTKSSIEEQK